MAQPLSKELRLASTGVIKSYVSGIRFPCDVSRVIGTLLFFCLSNESRRKCSQNSPVVIFDHSDLVSSRFRVEETRDHRKMKLVLRVRRGERSNGSEGRGFMTRRRVLRPVCRRGRGKSAIDYFLRPRLRFNLAPFDRVQAPRYFNLTLATDEASRSNASRCYSSRHESSVQLAISSHSLDRKEDAECVLPSPPPLPLPLAPTSAFIPAIFPKFFIRRDARGLSRCFLFPRS